MHTSSSFRLHTHTHIFIPCEDREPTGLKVDINRQPTSEDMKLYFVIIIFSLSRAPSLNTSRRYKTSKSNLSLLTSFCFSCLKPPQTSVMVCHVNCARTRKKKTEEEEEKKLWKKQTNLESSDCQILRKSFLTSERSRITRDCDINKVFCDHLNILWHCCWFFWPWYQKNANNFFSQISWSSHSSLTHLFTRRPYR